MLDAGLQDRFGNHPHVGEMRGRTFFRGIELVEDRSTKKPFDPGLKLHARIKSEAMAAVPTGGFFRSVPSLDSPDLQHHIVLYSNGGATGKHGSTLHEFSGLSATTIMLRPESLGTVEVGSANPRDAPLIKSRYLEAEHDRVALMRGVRAVRKIMRQPALEPFVGDAIEPGADVVTDDDMIEYLRNFGNTGFHPTSTCCRGVDETAVVDPRLRLHGFEGLRVVDASVMPSITSGNTNAPTIMIAEKAADMSREDARIS